MSSKKTTTQCTTNEDTIINTNEDTIINTNEDTKNIKGVPEI